MADRKRDPGKPDIGGGVSKQAPSREPSVPKKAPPPDRQTADNIAPGHGRRIPDKGE